MLEALISGFATLASPWPFFFLLAGTFLGVTIGAIPGLSGSMLIALTLPLTYYMDALTAVTLIIGMYVGSVAGGLISATLLRMPGTAAAVMTTFDGYPMARSGRPGRALGLGISASLVGGLISWMVLATMAKPISLWATRFGPFEYFTLILSALVLIAAVSQGSMLKGLIAGAFGILISMPGIDPSSGQPRMTWDWYMLNGGLKLMPVLLGAFVVSQILKDVLEINRRFTRVETISDSVFITLRDYRNQAVNLIRSSIIGTVIGILPGVGANIGSVVSYTAAKNSSREPERFGTGHDDGIVASEAANNATVGGALIPLIAMGIPGSIIDVFLIAALMIHSIQPGPYLFLNNAEIVWAMIAACLVANLMMFAIMASGAGFLSRLMYLPRAYLLPVVLTFCIVGAYGLDNTMLDVWVMLAFGLIGFFMERVNIPLGPFIIGFILAPLAEVNLRSGLSATAGDITPIFTRPLSLAFLVLTVALLVMPIVGEIKRRRAKS